MMMNTENKPSKAKSYFEQGYNCAQAVAMAFCGDLGMKASDASRYMAGFGAGFGRMREVCGAVSGMTFVLSTLYADRGTAYVYDLVQQCCKQFEADNGSLICRNLLGLSGNAAPTNPEPSKRNSSYYKHRPCSQLVYDAAQILEECINNN